MKLHENRRLFRQAVQFTADRMGIAAVYVEKDYWVTYALFSIFGSDVGRDAVFKGGTALSKCFNLIERFSEDIDLVVLRRDGETSNHLKTKLKSLSIVLNDVLPEVHIDGITHKMGMSRKTAHDYVKVFAGDYGQVRDVIVLESSWLGSHEPYSNRDIISYVGQMMLETDQGNMTEKFGLFPFPIKVLDPTRTICEKIMSLVRFSYGESPMVDLKNKVRHTYDLHQLLRQAELLEFFHSSAFQEMLHQVAKDDIEGFRNNNKWLAYHPAEAYFFHDLDTVWVELKEVYSSEFRNMVYGELPIEDEIFGTLKMIQVRLRTISWTLKLDP
jgi:hypothetical protein